MTIGSSSEGESVCAEQRPSLTIATAVTPVVVAALLSAAFWPVLVSMYGSWFDQLAYMEHGILVIPAAACMAWTKRERLAQVQRSPSMWGILLLLVGGAQALLGLAAHWLWVSRSALLVSLVGCVVALYGWRMVKELAYPICTLTLMIAPPTFVFERITLGLQLLSSRLGESLLEVLGYSVVREGNILELVGTKLSVEEACSGIRSLPAIVFITVLYGYFFVPETIIRAGILVAAIPVAVLGNAGRIVATGMAVQRSAALGEGAAHEAFGYVAVAVAAAGCVLTHLLMLFIRRSWRAHHA
jgi:exosortase